MASVIGVNRKARYEYEILETILAGIVLSGPEIKQLRAGRFSLNEAFAKIEGGEAWLFALHIPPYESAGLRNYDPIRKRKLLLQRKEIHYLHAQTQQKGMALVPLRLVLQHGFAKVEIGIGRGKREFDKRQSIAKKEARREAERARKQVRFPIPRKDRR